ncbi:MAG: PKD domain-containing protein [Gammaproteobacteria bacterium]|nr:PKD domain-containing protein [Gammaproteobacteria bacterium]
MCAALLASLSAHALNTSPLITFGSEAAPYDGDDNFVQLVFLQIPEAVQAPLYVRIFDPDCGGAWDESLGKWNTRTRFSLFGGKGAYSAPGLDQVEPPEASLNSGDLLVSEVFRNDPFTDNRWRTLAEIKPQDGEKIGAYYYLKLLVQGEAGNDGNMFDVMLSRNDKFNHLPEGAKMFNYAPTAAIPGRRGMFAEFRFFVPATVETLHIRNFDLEHTLFWFETPFESNFPLTASGQGKWAEDNISLTPAQTGQMGALMIKSPAIQHNNIVLSVQDQNQRALPIELPIRLHRKNKRPVPLARTEFLSDCRSVVFDASSSQDKDGRVSNYSWDFGDGTKAEGVRLIHQYKKPGAYDYRLTVQDDTGRVADRAQKTFRLLLNQPPTAGLDGETMRIGAPMETLRFSAADSSDADGHIKRYFWDFDDGQRARGANVRHAYQQAGLYQLRLRVEDDSSSPCNFDIRTRQVWINAPPVVDAGENKRVAALEDVLFDGSDSFDSDGSISRYQWDFGDGAQADGKNAVHPYEAPGSYKVTLTVTDNAGMTNSSAADDLTVIVNQPPRAAANVNTLIAATGEILHFSGLKSTDADGKVINWRWDFGDGAQAEGSQTEHAYAEPGTYKAELAVKDDSGTRSAETGTSFQLVINQPPTAKAGEDQHVTASEVYFDGSRSQDADGAITAWRWDFGDGQQGMGAQTVHIYRHPGRYPVQLTVTDDSGTSSQYDSDSLEVIINAKPVADAGPDRLAIADEIIDFNAQGAFDGDGKITRWQWDFGTGDSSTEKNPRYAFKHPGVYRVLLQVADETGHPRAIAFDEAIVTVNAPPVARAGADIHAAPNQPVWLDGSASYDADGKIKTYQWLFSDGKTTAGKARIKRRFAVPGIYTALLQITDNSGAANAQAEDSLSIYINHPPAAKISAKSHSCAHTLQFDGSGSTDADGDPLQYRWDFGDGTPVRHGVRVSHSYAKAGKYPVTLKVNDGSGQRNAGHITSGQIIINHPPTADGGPHRQACAGEVILFDGGKSRDADGGKLKYIWNFTNQTTLQGLNPIYTFNKGGIYPVKLTVEDDSGLACNADSSEFLVYVAEAPLAHAGPDQTVCAHTPVYFDGRASRDSDGLVNAYDWDFGDGGKGGGATPTHLYEFSGIYRVNLTITGDKYGRCANTHSDSMTVKVLTSPAVRLSAPDAIPVGESVRFDADAAGTETQKTAPSLDQWLWDFGDGQSSEGKAVEHVYAQAGVYTLKLTAKSASQKDCNQAIAQRKITVNAPPVAEAGEDRQVLVHQPVLFDASASADPDGFLTECQWDFGDGQTGSGCQALRHQYGKPGVYKVKLRVKDTLDLSNSYSEDSLQVQVSPLPEAEIHLSKQVYCAGESVVFESRSELASLPRQWHFGDGNSAKGRQVTHIYTLPGLYPASLETDDGNVVSTQMIRVNQPPRADIQARQQVCAGKKVKLNAGRSIDPDGKISAYAWQIGENVQYTGRKISHRFKQTGWHTITLNVHDDSGSICQTASSSADIKVNSPPTARIKLSDAPFFSGGAHDAILFDAGGSSDAEGDKLKYTWYFGDGGKADGRQLFHAYAKPGRYKIRLHVQDDSGTKCNSQRAERVIRVKKR